MYCVSSVVRAVGSEDPTGVRDQSLTLHCTIILTKYNIMYVSDCELPEIEHATITEKTIKHGAQWLAVDCNVGAVKTGKFHSADLPPVKPC